MKAVIVGGGIGGLASAVALTRAGWDVEVLEQASRFSEVGAGLSLWPNALRALDSLGLGDEVRARSQLSTEAAIRASNGRWLSRADFGAAYGSLAMVHRADLLDVLRTALPEANLRAGTTVRGVRPDGTVTFEASELRADLVVGADGIGSIVRRSVWGEAVRPRYAGYTAWRMVTSPVTISEGSETWGRGDRFGFAPLPDGRVYCFAVTNAPEGSRGEGLNELRRRFADWHAPIPSLLEATTPAAVFQHDLYDLPELDTYVQGSVALLGDAAHAMTPNLGQGAGQALEDAVVLAASLTDGGGLESYDHLRRPRTQMIMKRSRLIGQVAQWEFPITTGLRNVALRLTPTSTYLRSLAGALDWTAP